MITAAKNPKSGQVRIRRRRLEHVKMSPENEQLYRPIRDDDPEIIELAHSIEQHGVQEPLILSSDGYIISGHRRYVAAGIAGLATVPVRVKRISRARQRDKFLQLLRECNRQRRKTRDEVLREEVVSADPEEAYWSLIAHRQEHSIRPQNTIRLRGPKRRAAISDAKRPFLDAIIEIIEDRSDFWPLSDRQNHYWLLNDPPLVHASKPNSRYTNTKRSYKSLVDLLTRARLEGEIPMEAIGDETRPVVTWKIHQGVQSFLRAELNDLFKGYWRDLMQSQPNHVEVVGEKNTIASIIRPVCAQFCIPYTLGRGYCSLRPRYDLVERYRQSGKDRLVILFLSDFDPDGEEIAHSFARSLRDDFGVVKIDPVKVALTSEQVEQYDLPPIMTAKSGSANYDRFVKQHGDTVHELEALEPKTLQSILRESIDSVIDTAAFNYEIDQEKQDAAFLENKRRLVHRALAEIGDGMMEGDE